MGMFLEGNNRPNPAGHEGFSYQLKWSPTASFSIEGNACMLQRSKELQPTED
jgi:hypothetical protein